MMMVSQVSDPSESYNYLGLSTVVIRTQNETGMSLTYVKQSGESNGDAGDQYTGLDRFGRVVDQRWINSGGTAVDRYQYTYDGDGNVTAKDNLLDSAMDETYTYNDLNQLTVVTRGGSAYQSWVLDALGNMLSITDSSGTITRTYNDQNQMITDGTATLAYDSNGNMTTDDQGHTLVYNAWNELVEVLSGTTVLQQFTYDALGRMISETNWDGGGNTIYLSYNIWNQVTEEHYSEGDVAVQNVYSAVDPNELVLRDMDNNGDGFVDDEPTERTYVMQDANDDVTAMLTFGGAGTWGVSERVVYDAYGTASFMDASWTSSTNTLAMEYLYQDMRYDVTIGIYDDHARWYGPTLGRFGGPDPTGYPDGLNDLSFVQDNPVNFTDATGTSSNPLIRITHPCGAFIIWKDSNYSALPVDEARRHFHNGYQVTFDPNPAGGAKCPCDIQKVRLVQVIDSSSVPALQGGEGPKFDLNDGDRLPDLNRKTKGGIPVPGYIEGHGREGTQQPGMARTIFDAPGDNLIHGYDFKITIAAWEGRRIFGCVSFTYNNETGNLTIPGAIETPPGSGRYIVPAGQPDKMFSDVVWDWVSQAGK